uniref:Uncharacterized protein n=1 Tax=Anguilla anguilla TaxID=7936 RepID=A0A0E9PRK0_ANGAN
MKSPDPTPYLLTIIQISAILFSLQLRVTLLTIVDCHFLINFEFM